MDYFNDVLATFLSLDRVRILSVYESQKALGFHHQYLDLCSEDEGVAGLERHEGE